MKRSRFIVSPEALEDLDEIWLFIAEDSVETAEKVEKEFRKAFELLAPIFHG